MDDLLVELECPVCCDYLTIPIKQCATGHSICGKCIENLEKCPLCQREFTDSRNISLEALAAKVKYPCVNKNEGCDELLTYNEREQHEQTCTKAFKVSCAMENCPFIGDTKALKNHWMWKKTLFHNVQKDVLQLVNGYFKYDLMEAVGGEFFWFKRKTMNDKIYLAVQYIGRPEKTENFYFELEFSNGENSRNKLILSHICNSIKISDDMMFSDSHHSCSVGFDTIAPFITVRSCEGDQVGYTLKILQENASGNDEKKSHANKWRNNKTNRGKTGNKSQKNQPAQSKAKPEKRGNSKNTHEAGKAGREFQPSRNVVRYLSVNDLIQNMYGINIE